MFRFCLAIAVAVFGFSGAACNKSPPDTAATQKPATSGDARAQAAEVLDKLAEFFKTTTALQVRGEVSIEIRAPGQTKKGALTRSIDIERPNRVAVRTIKASVPAVELFCNGESLTTYVAAKKEYSVADAPSSLEEVSQEVLADLGGALAILPLALMTDDAAAQIQDGMSSVEYVAREQMNGKSVHHLKLTQEARDVELWISAEGPPLVHQVTMLLTKNREQNGQTLQMTMQQIERFSDWKLNAKVGDDAFAFSPPTGTKPVENVLGRRRPLIGKPAPPVAFKLLDGADVRLDEQVGKSVVMLDFWATWCGPCRAEMPLLAEIAAVYRDKGVKFYAVNLQEEPQQIRDYLASENLNVTVALDPGGEASKAFQVDGIPCLVLIDRLGVVRSVHVGYDPNIKSVLSQELDDLLAGRSPAE